MKKLQILCHTTVAKDQELWAQALLSFDIVKFLHLIYQATPFSTERGQPSQPHVQKRQTTDEEWAIFLFGGRRDGRVATVNLVKDRTPCGTSDILPKMLNPF